MYKSLKDVNKVDGVFPIIKQQNDIDMQQIILGDMSIDVVHKDIKNVHLSVYPPNGKVKISAPLRMDLDAIRVFAISKMSWINKQQIKLQNQER